MAHAFYGIKWLKDGKLGASTCTEKGSDLMCSTGCGGI